MAFHDIQFPTDISYRPTGGSRFQTSIGVVDSGFDYRNQAQAFGLGRWEVGHDARIKSQFETLRDFFNARKGQFHSFRFKDWSDFTATSSQGVFVMLTSTTFQMYKQYTSGSGTAARKITKPVSGTISFTGGVTPVANYATGVVTVASGTPTAWAGEHDYHVRFGTDDFDGVMLARSGAVLVGGWSGIPVQEIRE